LCQVSTLDGWLKVKVSFAGAHLSKFPRTPSVKDCTATADSELFDASEWERRQEVYPAARADPPLAAPAVRNARVRVPGRARR
jgi:hypothetical protein